MQISDAFIHWCIFGSWDLLKRVQYFDQLYRLSSTTNCRIIADLLEIENHELVRVRQLSYEISIITISSTTLECVPTLNGERMKIELDSILEMWNSLFLRLSLFSKSCKTDDTKPRVLHWQGWGWSRSASPPNLFPLLLWSSWCSSTAFTEKAGSK